MVRQKTDILWYYLPKTHPSYNNLESDRYKDLEEKKNCHSITVVGGVCFGWGFCLFWGRGDWCLCFLSCFVLNLGILKCLLLLL